MTREIKFRAWDGEQKKMCHKVYVGSEGWRGEHWQDGMMVSCFSDINHKENVLMQFTGLHDKNGKEIWEGDIVRQEDVKGVIEWFSGTKDINGGEYAGLYTGFTVNGNGIAKKYEFSNYGGDGGIETDNCEIIGNIYEKSRLEL